MVSPKSPKMTVGFVDLEANQVFPVLHLNDMTQQEIDDSWYSDNEYNGMKKDLIAVVKRMNKGQKIVETDQHTTRGLEIRTKQGYRVRQFNKKVALEAVLDEQHRQAEKNIWDDDFMKDAYRMESAGSEYIAHARGLKDEAEILIELNKIRYEFGTGGSKDLKLSWRGLRGFLTQHQTPEPVAMSA